MKSISLRVQLIGGIILAILLTVAAVNIIFANISYTNAEDAAGRVYENLSYDIADFFDKNIAEVHVKLSAFSQIAAIADPATPIEERVAVSRAVQSALGAGAALKITDLDGKELVMPDEAEIDLSNRNYIQASLRGETFVTSPFYSPVLSRIMLVISQPLRWNNEIVGVIFMLLPGDFMNNAIEAVKAGYDGYACAFDSTGALVSHSDIIGLFERDENKYIEMAKTDRAYEGMAEAVQTMLRDRRGTLLFTNPEGERMLGGFSSTKLGWTVLVTSTLDDVRTDANHAIRNAIIASIICIVVVALLAFVLIGNIVSRISFAARRLGRMAQGDLSADIPKTSSKSEVGMLIYSLDEVVAMMRSYISDITKTLVAVENGNLDYASDQEYKGDFSDIKKALTGIVGGLSTTMGSIMESTSHVASGSKQIADSAQSLAQGATEQAASIQELSASIAGISQRTKDNADMADKAARLVDKIRTDAEKGSRQMDDMTSAVREISQASQSISKIIKVIDDIAFQTNILALNAAVEAARAGQHGKGFAVVAEEVRNLAAKSAEAAKDTGELIVNSMDKAELGSRIAGETAGSLADIVSGIIESSSLIADIAMASEEQSKSIEQINTGVDQVATVVQQNSATAEESAATSEEMSSQTAQLQSQISQFMLSESSRQMGARPNRNTGSKRYSPPGVPGLASPGSGGFGKY